MVKSNAKGLNLLYSSMQKWSIWDLFALGFWLVLIALSINWYQERMLLPDPAFYLWNIINGESFLVVDNRYTAILTQVFPLVATWLEAPLSTILVSYSVGFVTLAVACYFVARCIWQNQVAGITIILIFSTGVAYSYFRPTSEK